MKVFYLKKDGGRKTRQESHPWVMKEDLEAPNLGGVLPGDIVELRSFDQKFVAQGFVNPNSKIFFRALSFSPLTLKNHYETQEFWVQRLLAALKRRCLAGIKASFRLCFSEADDMPGLIIDRFLLPDNQQVLSLQVSSFGMERWVLNRPEILSEFLNRAFSLGLFTIPFKNSAVLIRNDIKVRSLEGLEPQDPRLLIGPQRLCLDQILLDSGLPEWQKLQVNLFTGQKTGFFLDQRQNILNLIGLLKRIEMPQLKGQARTLRILDICCYVGQTSAALLAHFKDQIAEVVLVDSSEEALKLSAQNLSSFGVKVSPIKLDVLSEQGEFFGKQGSEDKFDVVIVDPPALIKAKKDIPQGLHAYLKLNSWALSLGQDSGFIFVSASCSGHLRESDFLSVLARSEKRSGKRLSLLMNGGHGADHPIRPGFPEGEYLKLKVYAAE